MKPIADILEARVSKALAEATGQAAPGIVKPTQDARFGDYQANGVMGLAKRLGKNPRELAQAVLERLDVADMCEEPTIAGPGFINFRLRPDWLAARLADAITDEQRLGIDPATEAPATVVDFSGPNIAKQMHVGHLRSTIIGDVIARVLEFWYDDPSKVIRQNHVGDWGLQMGMVLEAMSRRLLDDLVKKDGTIALEQLEAKDPNWWKLALDETTFDLDELERLYKGVVEIVKTGHPSIVENYKRALVGLQQGNAESIGLWKKAREISLNACLEIYHQLGVKLGLEDVRGESFYNDKLPSVISALSAVNLLEESDGAQCVFMEGFKTKEGEPLPLIVRKSDGAYLYATTDLAAIRHRVDELGAQRIVYVTDARQKLHFEMVFTCAKKAGWAGESVQLEHVPFGSVLGPDLRPLKTREGENVKLKDLLDEAQARARRVVDEKNPDLSKEDKERIALAVGIGAVKYADLSSNLVSDYVFDWDKMLAMEGNTAPYMQYAYARVQSIFRKGVIDPNELLTTETSLTLEASEELELAKRLLRYSETVESVARDLRPHLLTNYLFELAQAFSGFYTNCPVLKAQGHTRATRLLLCYQTARTLRHGLGLLGIATIEQM